MNNLLTTTHVQTIIFGFQYFKLELKFYLIGKLVILKQLTVFNIGHFTFSDSKLYNVKFISQQNVLSDE